MSDAIEQVVATACRNKPDRPGPSRQAVARAADPDLPRPRRICRPDAELAAGRRKYPDLHRCSATQECSDCPAAPLIAPDAIEEIILRLYGPKATGQVSPANIHSFTFDDLGRMLAGSRAARTTTRKLSPRRAGSSSRSWTTTPRNIPRSAALRSFLAERSDSLRDKRLVVLAFSAPYYLDTTEISKLTAYFGVYGQTAPFLEMAVRALFPRVHPDGCAAGLSQRHQLRADPPAGAGGRPDHRSEAVSGDQRQHPGGRPGRCWRPASSSIATATRCPMARRSSSTCAIRPNRWRWRPRSRPPSTARRAPPSRSIGRASCGSPSRRAKRRTRRASSCEWAAMRPAASPPSCPHPPPSPP